jgi:hypothetical protein
MVNNDHIVFLRGRQHVLRGSLLEHDLRNNGRDITAETLLRNNYMGPRQFNNDRRYMAWRAPLECQCTAKSTLSQSLFLLSRSVLCHHGMAHPQGADGEGEYSR